MLTQKYKNGFITLNAEKFSPVTQETIDREIKNFEPMKKAIEKLYEYEQKDISMKIIIYGALHLAYDLGIIDDEGYSGVTNEVSALLLKQYDKIGNAKKISMRMES